MVALVLVDPRFFPRAHAQGSLYSHGDPTSYEQYMLELVNSARSDPGGTAARLGIGLNDGLAGGAIATNAKAPFAFHPLLIVAARNHSDWMLATGVFSHTGVDGTTPTQRAARAGFTNGVAENIGYQSTSGSPDYAALARDVHEALFRSPGHRENLMDETYSVVGLGLRPGFFRGFNAFMATQKFSEGSAAEDSGPFILGVCYDDADGDGAYDPGEGVGSVRVDTSLGQRHAVTSASGGYAIPLLPVATNTATNNLSFAVQGAAWTAVEPHDAQFRAAQLASAPVSTVQVVWSAGPLARPVTNGVVIREPRRVNYILRGTDGFFYSRTMVTAQSVKKDLRIQDVASATPVPTPTPTPTPSLSPTPEPTPTPRPPAGTKEQRATFKLPAKMVFDGSYVLRAKFSAKAPVTYSVDKSQVAEVSGNQIKILKAGGQFTVTARHAGDATWAAKETTASGTAAKRPQKIAFTLKGAKAVGEPFNLLATVNSPLAITFTSSASEIVRVNDDGTATALAEGRAVLTAAQAGNENYAAAKPVKKTVVVK